MDDQPLKNVWFSITIFQRVRQKLEARLAAPAAFWHPWDLLDGGFRPRFHRCSDDLGQKGYNGLLPLSAKCIMIAKYIQISLIWEWRPRFGETPNQPVRFGVSDSWKTTFTGPAIPDRCTDDYYLLWVPRLGQWYWFAWSVSQCGRYSHLGLQLRLIWGLTIISSLDLSNQKCGLCHAVLLQRIWLVLPCFLQDLHLTPFCHKTKSRVRWRTT